MKAVCRKKDGAAFVSLSGELDHHGAAAILDKLKACAEDEAVKKLVVDMSKVTFMDSSGIGALLGRYKTMSEKKEYMASNLDYLRTALLLEPRGHSDMFGAIMTSPTIPDADFGVIFMESGGYVNMCGHGTIGVCTVAVEMGMVTPIEPITNITLDTPVGIVKAGVAVSNGRTKGVTFENVPAFLYKKDVSINTPTFGEIKMDIAFGGNFFAMISAERLGLKIEKPYAQRLIDAGMEILECVNNSIQVGHPEKPHINTIDLVEIFEKVPQEGVLSIIVCKKGWVR